MSTVTSGMNAIGREWGDQFKDEVFEGALLNKLNWMKMNKGKLDKSQLAKLEEVEDILKSGIGYRDDIGLGKTEGDSVFLNEFMLSGAMGLDGLNTALGILGWESERNGINDGDQEQVKEGIRSANSTVEMVNALKKIYGKNAAKSGLFDALLAVKDMGDDVFNQFIANNFDHSEDNWKIKEVDGKLSIIFDNEEDIYYEDAKGNTTLLISHDTETLDKINTLKTQLVNISSAIPESVRNELKLTINDKINKLESQYNKSNNVNDNNNGYVTDRLVANLFGVSYNQVKDRGGIQAILNNIEGQGFKLKNYGINNNTQFKWMKKDPNENWSFGLDEGFQLDISDVFMTFNNISNKRDIISGLSDNLQNRINNKIIDAAIKREVYNYIGGTKSIKNTYGFENGREVVTGYDYEYSSVLAMQSISNDLNLGDSDYDKKLSKLLQSKSDYVEKKLKETLTMNRNNQVDISDALNSGDPNGLIGRATGTRSDGTSFIYSSTCNYTALASAHFNNVLENKTDADLVELFEDVESNNDYKDLLLSNGGVFYNNAFAFVKGIADLTETEAPIAGPSNSSYRITESQNNKSRFGVYRNHPANKHSVLGDFLNPTENYLHNVHPSYGDGFTYSVHTRMTYLSDMYDFINF